MNLTLIYPPKIDGSHIAASDISLALLYLSGAAREICNSIKIFDFNVPRGSGKTVDNLISNLHEAKDEKPVIGINCLYSAVFPKVREIAQKIKQEFPLSKIAIGGMHPTLFAEQIIKYCPEFDAVIIGEGDDSFIKYLEQCFGGGVEGVCVRDAGEIVMKDRLSYIENIDNLPRPGYEFFNFDEYLHDASNWYSPDGFLISDLQMSILTSRSCPNLCNFCNMYRVMGRRFRARSAENVFEEIKFLYEEYGVNYFRIMDDNFTFNRDRAAKICQLVIESGMKIYFDTPNGISAKNLDLELLKLMRRAGFIIVAVAVESGSEYVRNQIMGKRISEEQILNVFKWCREVGIMAKSYFIIGMPEDTEETLKATEELIIKMDTMHVTLSVAMPLPGTRLYEQCERDNLFVHSKYQFSWEGDMSTKEGSYYQHSANILKREFRIKPYNMSVEKLEEFDLRLQEIANRKGKEWIERTKNVLQGRKI